jgi:hypothetical protein
VPDTVYVTNAVSQARPPEPETALVSDNPVPSTDAAPAELVVFQSSSATNAGPGDTDAAQEPSVEPAQQDAQTTPENEPSTKPNLESSLGSA